MPTACLAQGQPSSVHHGAPLPPAASQARAVRQRLATTWERRARVTQPAREGETLFDASTADFLPALLPLQDQPAFLAAPDAMRQQLLSCGWLAYNEQTVAIAAQIVAPACHHIIAGDVPGLHDGVSRQMAGQTLVDEAYHALLVLHACQVTHARRGLGALTVPESQLIVKMRHAQAQCSARWQQVLVQLRQPLSRRCLSAITYACCRRRRPSSYSIG